MSSIKRKLSEPSNVSRRLFELKASGTLCDVQLQLLGKTMIAHACVLASSSPYFLQLFNLNPAIHWCARNPLVIDLEKLLSGSKELCVICVSKIIDFMYLRELVILQDHYEHFVEINNVFRVFDSLPLGESCKRIKLGKPENVSKKSEIVEIPKNDTADLLSKQALSVQSVNVDNFSNSSSTNLLDSLLSDKVNTSKNTIGKDKSKLNSANSSLVTLGEENLNDNEKVLGVVPDSQIRNVEKESSLKKPCKFMCCNPEPEVNSNLAKLRKRRKMVCELCDFSSVSIKKVLQHIRSAEHIQSVCPICLIKMSNCNDLKDHLKDHVDSKPFICQICKKRNRYWDYHKMHMKIHCRNKSFYCDFCRRGFVSKRSLSEHLTTHKGSYLCENCDYYTSDLNMYRSHLLEHEIKVANKSDLSSKFNFDSDSRLTKQNSKRFNCQICSEGFTQKKNLVRHVKLKHFDTTKFTCSMCAFVSDRIDLISNHMKKKHGCTLVKENNKSIIENKLNIDEQSTSELVGVLIPIQLVPDNCSISSSFVIDGSKRSLSSMHNTKHDSNEGNTFLSPHVHQNSNVELGMYVESEVTVHSTVEHTATNELYAGSSDTLQEDNILLKGSSKVEQSETIHSENKNNIQPDFMSVSHNFVNLESADNSSQPLNGSDIRKVSDNENISKEEVLMDGSQYIWLNETTGELLNNETFMNLQAQKTKSNQQVLGADNSSFEFCEKLKSSLMNEAAKECSTFDFIDENEEWQLPQTPKAGVVGIDDCDNRFSWNQIDNSFYSTWVLNEATGELNMVSFFSIQSVRNPTELELGEKSKSTAPLEDDDTALFLNEGTGDLSVIYFKPNELERDDLNVPPCGKPSHENLDTLSEISDNDSDFLNEEFMRVSANFMSNEENEKFLNELTGEFDIANLDNYRTELLNDQVSGNESYLNEETGEISWNAMDKNGNNDLFAKPDALDYDLDDSLNCEDFEPFFRDVSEFSSQFCLDKASESWQSAEEASDALVLNECTGELVKKN